MLDIVTLCTDIAQHRRSAQAMGSAEGVCRGAPLSVAKTTTDRRHPCSLCTLCFLFLHNMTQAMLLLMC